MSRLLRRIQPDALPTLRRAAVDAQTLAAVAPIVTAVRQEGDPALRRHAERFEELGPGGALVLGPEALKAAFAALSRADQGVLQRTAGRIQTFASAQAEALKPVLTEVPGGRAGLRYAPVERAGCYAPGGRFPLPSSVLMTAVTARAAGVPEVWVASPRPSRETLAAAHVAGADALVCAGGAQAIAALAYGTASVPPCDAIVGPGSRWVTAAKQLVAGEVTIDMLAGPSELVVLADDSADPERIAADLLAQAEHDPDALPVLVSLAAGLVDRVEAALVRQLATLPTADIARAALANGFAVVVETLESAVEVCDRLAPEHLAVHTREAAAVARRLKHYGAVFVGEGAAEVLGDYGAGPNHVLPTGGTARSVGALSVATFLRVQTWLELDQMTQAQQLVEDTISLARMEGLEAHARAAEARRVAEP
jgi:phosphoribosyl-ATP pyrophosphohydrolase/phosphoribosyl-AMP cyclohydrolase/histidinol dehydrogenase